MNKQIFFALWLLASGIAYCQAPPKINHLPITTAQPGQAIPVTATVDGHGQTLTEVNIHVSLAENDAPIKIPLVARGAGAYMGTIPAAYNNRISSLSYYIEAKTPVDFAETDFYNVKIQPLAVVPPGDVIQTEQNGNLGSGRTGTTTKPVPKKKDRSWVVPAVIVGVGAVVVGGVVALSDSGGGGSNNNQRDPDPDPDPTPVAQDPTPITQDPSPTDAMAPTANPITDPTTTPITGIVTNPVTVDPTIEDPSSTREVITQAANDTVRSAIVNLPVQTVINPTARFAGRSLITTSINLSYDPVDGRSDRFLVLVDGAVVLDTGPVTAPGNLNVVVPNGSGVVTISVPFSLRDADNIFNWSWAAAIAYTVE